MSSLKCFNFEFSALFFDRIWHFWKFSIDLAELGNIGEEKAVLYSLLAAKFSLIIKSVLTWILLLFLLLSGSNWNIICNTKNKCWNDFVRITCISLAHSLNFCIKMR